MGESQAALGAAWLGGFQKAQEEGGEPGHRGIQLACARSSCTSCELPGLFSEQLVSLGRGVMGRQGSLWAKPPGGTAFRMQMGNSEWATEGRLMPG